jgi:hypothetical protein
MTPAEYERFAKKSHGDAKLSDPSIPVKIQW